MATRPLPLFLFLSALAACGRPASPAGDAAPVAEAGPAGADAGKVDAPDAGGPVDGAPADGPARDTPADLTADLSPEDSLPRDAPAEAREARFLLRNATGRPIYVQASGQLNHQEYWGLRSGTEELPVDDECGLCPCERCFGCAVCGASIATVTQVPAGGTHAFTWDGRVWRILRDRCNVGCKQVENVPPGPLTLRVRYSFTAVPDPQVGTGQRVGPTQEATVAFDHPPAGVVEVVAR